MSGTHKEFETVERMLTSDAHLQRRRFLRHLDEDARASFLISLRSIGGIDTPIQCARHHGILRICIPAEMRGKHKWVITSGENGVISMNRIAEIFWIASALVLGVALAVVAVPIVAIVCFLALALPVAMRRVHRHRYFGDGVSPSTRKGPADRSRVPPTIETTYTVVGRS